MKLGIISDSHHYYAENGQLYNLTPLASQFDCWAAMFDEVFICAPLLTGQPPSTHSPYKSLNIHLLPIENAGGDTLYAKLVLSQKVIGWWGTLRKLMNQVDAVHIRCPNNIGILALLITQQTKLLRQAVYTGSWLGHTSEAPTYKLQRLFLKNFFHGPVAVYGEWPKQPSNIVSSFSPSYSQSDWDLETLQVTERLARLNLLNRLSAPVHLMSVGGLNRNKNQQLILHSLPYLLHGGIDFTLDILGDGDQRFTLEQQVQKMDLTQRVFFHGNVSQEVVRQFYRRSDFVIQAPYSEGFGKVPVEAFFHGVIPILSDVDMSKQIIGDGSRGRCFRQGDANAIAQHIMDFLSAPSEMSRMIENGRQYALGLTLEAWQEHIQEMLNRYWKTHLKPSDHYQ